MRYQSVTSDAIYHRHELGDVFPNVSLPAGELSQDSMELLGLVAIADDPPAPLSPEVIQEIVITSVQQRLDSFARERGYDSILSACTYATSSIPQFVQDSKTCTDARDNTWAVLYDLLEQVKQGFADMPQSYADVEPLLPTLTWNQ